MSKHLKLPTLLVIADNPSIRFWVKKHLNDQFFILEAITKRGALEAIRNSSLDFIILDSGFEDCDPLKLCKEMRPLLHSSLTPILLVTGRLKKSYRDEALEAGVSDFLNDQLDLEELETRIATGRKAASVRQKTIDVSAALKKPKKENL
jgi:PleD family two-component response regulator